MKLTEKFQIIRIHDLSRQLCVSKATIFRWRREKRIPPPLNLGSRMVGWRTTDIELWLESASRKGGI